MLPKRPINGFLVMLLMLAAVCILTGCQMTEEEQATLEAKKAEIVAWITEKYGEEPEVDSYGYVYSYSGEWVQRSDNIHVLFTDGTECIWYADEDIFVDDRQSEEIVSAFQEEIWKPLLEDYLVDYEIWSYAVNTINAIRISGDYDENSSWFTEYYDGNIYSYLQKEDIRVTGVVLCFTTQQDWKETMTAFETAFYSTVQGQDHVLKVYALSEDCWARYENDEIYFPDAGTDECWAVYSFGGKAAEHIVQCWQYVGHDTYITSAMPDFTLEEDDITFTQVCDADTFLSEKWSSDEYELQISDGMWQMTLSSRALDCYEETGQLTFYVKYLGEETLCYACQNTSDSGPYNYVSVVNTPYTSKYDSTWKAYGANFLWFVGTRSNVQD